jgi:hypothetical protein
MKQASGLVLAPLTPYVVALGFLLFSRPWLEVRETIEPPALRTRAPSMRSASRMRASTSTSFGVCCSTESLRELMTAAVVVRSMLRVSPTAYQEACEVMGPENAAVAVACILERAGHISSAGGYLLNAKSGARRADADGIAGVEWKAGAECGLICGRLFGVTRDRRASGLRE